MDKLPIMLHDFGYRCVVRAAYSFVFPVLYPNKGEGIIFCQEGNLFKSIVRDWLYILIF